jgi:hypothetical protein
LDNGKPDVEKINAIAYALNRKYWGMRECLLCSAEDQIKFAELA